MNCIKCGKLLKGKQTKFCCERCSKNYLKAQYRKRNRNSINKYNREWRRRQQYTELSLKSKVCFICGSNKELSWYRTKYGRIFILPICKSCLNKFLV